MFKPVSFALLFASNMKRMTSTLEKSEIIYKGIVTVIFSDQLEKLLKIQNYCNICLIDKWKMVFLESV